MTAAVAVTHNPEPWLGVILSGTPISPPAWAREALEAAGEGLALEPADLSADPWYLDGRRREAREPLRSGLELARICGAAPLATRAEEELRASGASRRDVIRAGVDTLTTSERRVAQLAATGISNKQIAQTLFVTVKTVETHLHRSYQKLDVTSRAQLAAALEPAP